MATQIVANQGLFLCGLVGLQLLVVVVFAAVVLRKLKVAPVYANQAWRFVLVLSLCLIPANVLLRTWVITVQAADVTPERLTESEVFSSAGLINQTDPPESLLESDSPVGVLGNNTSRPTQVRVRTPDSRPDAVGPAPDVALASVRNPETLDAQVTLGETAAAYASEAAGDNWRVLLSTIGVVQVLCALYLVGVFWQLIRVFLSWLALAKLVAEARPVASDLQAAIAATLQKAGLRQSPQVLESVQQKTPLACGLFAPKVIVPSDFSSWAREEQEAVLLHEFAHIERKDLLAELGSQIARTIYWFHPAVYWIQQQLILTREQAADQYAVERGIPPKSYANSLLSVIALSSTEGDRFGTGMQQTATMSAQQIQRRIEMLVNPVACSVGRWKMLAFVASVFVLVFGLMFRVEVLAAPQSGETHALQTSGVQVNEVEHANQTQAATKSEAMGGIKHYRPISSDENDFLRLIQNCEVAPASTEEVFTRLTISGQILHGNNEPVSGATVLLRESSTQRLSENPLVVKSRRWDWNETRVNDVLAKTTTDASGRYKFEAVDLPDLTRNVSAWDGSIVAAHADLGIGYTAFNLPAGKIRERLHNQNVILSQLSNIEGRLQTPNGRALAGTVAIFGIHQARPASTHEGKGWDLQASQIAPRTNTDSDGKFAFHNLPSGFAATVKATPKNIAWLRGGIAVATSADTPTGSRGPFAERHPGIQDELFGSPVTINAKPAAIFSGRVLSPSGEPVEGVRVHLGAYLYYEVTNSDGKFEIQVFPDRKVNSSSGKKTTTITLRPPDGAKLLLKRQELTRQELMAGYPFDFLLTEGAWVRGVVQTQSGQPLPNVEVEQVGPWRETVGYGKSDEQGRYELLLPPGEHLLVFSTDQPGHELPSCDDASRLHGSRDAVMSATGFVTRTVTIADVSYPPIDLKPVLVKPTEVISLQAVLPGGEPAIGASAVLMDIQRRVKPDFWIPDFPTEPVSQVVNADENGAATLIPTGILSKRALVKISHLSDEGTSFTREIRVSQIAHDEPVVLVKQWPLKGRVTINGAPVAGATMSIGRSQAIQGKPGGSAVIPVATATSDQDGYYTVPVPPGQNYTVLIKSIPGMNKGFWTGHNAIRDAQKEQFTVREFALRSATDEIVGHVIDAAGNPLADVRIQFAPFSRVRSSDLLGFSETSQQTTDARGFFALRAIPAGTHELVAYGPDTYGPGTELVLFKANAGDKNVTVVFDPIEEPEPIRLQPKRIVAIP